MPRKAKRKIKDLVEMLEDPDNSGYVGDYEDMMELMEEEELDLDELEDQEEIE
ncbi:MAG: hypothetical protein DHS20C13_14200 [Thermodesulfobacteriota bacterium]|nr:MAG: hypothetical protein DHS20C13_14200 [Thermodesulfobacteriota bacterium]